MSTKPIMECIEFLTGELNSLRNELNLTQKDFADIIGISRQSVIDLEHQNRKITKAILIAMISFFSLQSSTAHMLYEKKFYDMEYVASLGFSSDVIRRIHDWSGE